MSNAVKEYEDFFFISFLPWENKSNFDEKDNKILVLFGIRSNKFIHYSFHLGIEERTETT
ncbi:hypothetical protein DERF_003312 [Dermatophagoides farinae]|uniref:Uncharacterized protein n=1 Tax=Dermatophagoides farinae TaxID=6954 RepID=A0A922IET3_DERFA|nr:hypothetical protein DERF_003312 [Dermatophagoides farinae]